MRKVDTVNSTLSGDSIAEFDKNMINQNTKSKQDSKTNPKQTNTKSKQTSYNKANTSSVIMVNSDARKINCVNDQYRLLFDIGHSDGSHFKIDEMNNSILCYESCMCRIDLAGFIQCPVTTTGTLTLFINSSDIEPLTTWYVKTFTSQIILNGLFTIFPIRKGDVIKLTFIPDGHEYLKNKSIVVGRGTRIAVTKLNDDL